MIVRKHDNLFYLIPQHEHALISGELAAYLQNPPKPLVNVLYAISHHDVAWQELDQQIMWNEETNEPFSFESYPLAEKIDAYQQGIAQVVAKNVYAGYLVSKHYAQFFANDSNPLAVNFRHSERIRQHQLRPHFTQEEQQNLPRNYRLLRFCDDLSLALCLNEPMMNTHPWFRDGVDYQKKRYVWNWEDKDRIRLSPNPFHSSFTIEIPYQVFDRNRQRVSADRYRWTVLAE